jgi:hypothetical protein
MGQILYSGRRWGCHGGRPRITGNLKMENLNFDNDAVIDPRDAEIAELRQQLEEANNSYFSKAEQLNQFSKAIMDVIGDSVIAVAESVAGDTVENALNDFDIYNYNGDIDDMIDDRLPEGLDAESRSEDLKAAIKEVLAGATLTMDIE